MNTLATVKANDLLLRLRMYGSSPKLIEELSFAGDSFVDKKALYETAVELAPVNSEFFASFLTNKVIANPTQLFQLYYQAACLSPSPQTWRNLISVAQLPQVDFNAEGLGVNGPGPPTLFPAPDLFMGILDFPMSLALCTLMKQRWKQCSTEVEAGGSSMDALCGGLDISPMVQLYMAALSIVGHHPTAMPSIWSLIRTHDAFRDFLDKFENAEGKDDALWGIFTESWKIRLLYYRELNVPSLSLSEVFDEYRLFEDEVPEFARVLQVPIDLVLTDMDKFKTLVVKQMMDLSMDEEDRSSTNSSKSKLACVALAEQLMQSSERVWKKQKQYELGIARTDPNETQEDVEEELEQESSTMTDEPWTRTGWTSYVNFLENELARVSDTQSPPEPAHGDLLGLIESVLMSPRNKITVLKRRVASTYIRAIEQVGGYRLDLFEGFWDFLNRAASDNLFVPSRKWLTFWQLWIAETAARHQPQKSCCWQRLLNVWMRVMDCENTKAFVKSLCEPRQGPFWKALNAPPWWKVYDVLPPPKAFRLDEGELCVPNEETLQMHTSEFLHVVAEALKVTEEVSRLFASQDTLFMRSSEPQSALPDLLESILHILSQAEDRVFDMLQYLSTGLAELQGVNGDPSALFHALFFALMNVKVMKGLYIAKLATDALEHLLDLFLAIDTLATVFQPLVVTTDEEIVNFLATVWNLKIGLILAVLVCTDVRYFGNNLRGSWISTCLLKGELDPRVTSQTMLGQSVDVSFQTVLQTLAEDEHFQELKRHSCLLERISFLSEVAAIGAEVFFEKHQMFVLLEWLSRLADAIKENREWTIPEDSPESISLLVSIPLPPPMLFPKLGASLRVGLDELRDRPFHHPAPLRRSTITDASMSSSSSSSDAGTPLLPRHPSPIASPTRRLSFEDVEVLTRATRDGREAPLPSLAPSIPPQLLRTPPSGESTPPTNEDENAIRETPKDERLTKDEQPTKDEQITSADESAPTAADEGGGVTAPQKGHHYRQQKLNDNEVPSSNLFGGGHVEWNTLYISNLEAAVTTVALAQELRAVGCRDIVEVRIPRDRHRRSKGFAYVEFQTPDAAQHAEKAVNGRLINGFRISAAISIPKTPVYEEKVLFVSNLPTDFDASDLIKDAINEVLATQFQQGIMKTRKRCSQSDEGLVAPPKRHRRNSSEFTPADEVKAPPSAVPHVEQPWHVTDVRLIPDTKGVSKYKGYGYVELDRAGAVQQLLEAQAKSPIVIGPEKRSLLLAPSVPKKEPKKPIHHPSKKQQSITSSSSSTLCKTLFISGLPKAYSEQRVREVLEPFGMLAKLSVPSNPSKPHHNRGFALAEYHSPLDASTAITSLNGTKLADNKSVLSVQHSSREIHLPDKKERRPHSRIDLTTTTTTKAPPAAPTSPVMTNDDFRRKFLL